MCHSRGVWHRKWYDILLRKHWRHWTDTCGFSPGRDGRCDVDVGVGNIHDVPLFPTQVWESVGALSLFGALAWMHAKLRFFDGQIMATMMVFYAALRSTIEGFRGDSIRGEDLMLGLSTSQSISVFIVALAMVVVMVQFRKGKGPEKPIARDELDDELDSDDDLLG